MTNSEKKLSDLEHRISRVEESQQKQSEELHEVAESLKGIQQILTKIQYVGYGALALFLFQEIGIVETLKKLI